LKLKAKAAVKYVTDYEEAMIQFARKSGVHGVICGHVHRPEIRQAGEVVYMNCGDWVENCTALAEHFDGRIELIRYKEPARRETNDAQVHDLLPVAASRQGAPHFGEEVSGALSRRLWEEVS
jgi:hypothetical protein